jgi:putative ABC transport system permease protein
MSLWRQLTRGVGVLAHRDAADRDVADECDHFLEQAIADLEARGLSPEEARRAARRELGNPVALREEVRSYGWENAFAAFFADLRYAARRLRRSPGFAAIGVLTLALGIGATTAIFSAVNPILFESLPYPHAERILGIWDRGSDGSPVTVTFGTFRELLARARSFDSIAVWKTWQPTMTGAAEPERLDGQRVSAGYFRVLGVPPALGRDFDPADDRLGGPRVAILSDRLWRRRFAADPAIVGRQIKLDDDLFTVAGVMPKAFESVLAPSAQVWTLLQYDTSLPPGGPEWGHHLRMAARLRAGLGAEPARRELDGITRAPVPEISRPSWAKLEHGLLVSSIQDDVTGGVRPALLAVLGAVTLVLLIACVNVTNLLLARGAARSGELSMRAALGAGRPRLIRQLVTEGLLLSLLGGALGMAVAQLGVRALVALSPSELPRADAIRFDGAVFVFALAVTMGIGLLVGLIPALQTSRVDLHEGLRQGSRRTAGGHRRARRALVVAEVALALVLLVGAGLLLRSMRLLFAVAPGFDPSHVLAMQVQTNGHRYDDAGATHRFFAAALEAVRRTPGVTAAAFTSQLPLSGDADFSNVYGVHFEHDRDPKDEHDAFRCAVSPSYFETLGIPLRRGRPLDEHDVAGAAIQAALISESFARRKFPGQDPVGQRLSLGAPTGRPWSTIVGVVGDVKQTSLAAARVDSVYIAADQSPWADGTMWFVVRAQGDAAALTAAVKRAVWSVDKDQPIVHVAAMDTLVAASAAERRFALVLFEAFALTALVLAAIGIYGVLSGSVNEQTREIGVRSALGATAGEILALVVRQGLGLAGLGAVLGLAGALLASQALTSLLFGVSSLDPVTYLGVIALLLAVSALACWAPAWRASRVEPSITLRAE